MGELTFVLCIVWGCGSKSGKLKGLGFFRIPRIITGQGEEYEELTRKRRERWISAVSRGDTAEKNILETERVCGRHFHQGQPAKDFDQFSPDWVPSLNLGKKEYRRPRDFKASVERSERVERRRKAAIEQQEQEATKNRKLPEQSGDRICDIDFESGASTSETTEEQLTDGMDTDNFCDGQGAKCETIKSSHIPPHKQSPKWHQLLPVKGLKLKSLSIYLKDLVTIRHMEEIFSIPTTKCGFIRGCRPSKCC